MLLPEIRPFLSANQYLSTFGVDTPEQLDSALWDAQQALPYLPPDEHALLKRGILELGKKLDESFSDLWLSHAYFIGTSDASSAIKSFAESREPNHETLAHANRYQTLLELENTVGSHPPEIKEANLHRPEFNFSTITELLTHLSESPLPGFAPVLATDCDGTTWKGDIGELLFETAFEQGRLLPAALPGLQLLLQSYDIPSQNEANADAKSLSKHFGDGSLLERGISKGKSTRDVILDYYQCNAQALAGHHVATIKAWTKALFDAPEGIAADIYPEVLAILSEAEGHGFLTLAISASNVWSVQIGASYLGIPLRHCRGITTEVSSQLISSTLLPPVPYGDGKLEAIQTICGGLPLLALGDSFEKTDKEMLEKAGFGGVIQPVTEKAANRLKSVAPGHWFALEPYSAEVSKL